MKVKVTIERTRNQRCINKIPVYVIELRIGMFHLKR